MADILHGSHAAEHPVAERAGIEGRFGLYERDGYGWVQFTEIFGSRSAAKAAAYDDNPLLGRECRLYRTEKAEGGTRDSRYQELVEIPA